MDELRPTTKAYLAVLLALAAGLTFVAARGISAINQTQAIVALGVAACMVAAWLFPIQFAPHTKLYVDTAVSTAAVLLLPPALAAMAVGAGTLLAHGLRREMRDWAQAFFNMAQVMLVALTAALLLALAGWLPGESTFHSPALLILPVVAIATYLINVALIALITALEAQAPLLPGLRATLRVDARAETLAHASLVTIGALSALVINTEPWCVFLLVVPIVATHMTLNRQTTLRREAEMARLMSDASLAEAQRLAHLGSWEWYPATNLWVWSDEVYRLFGMEPRSVVPTYAEVVAAVHPIDRERVEQTLQHARRTGTPFEIEHQVWLSDGTERQVHQRCEIRPENGKELALLGTIQDITEQVRTTRAIREAARAAQQADRAKSQLLTMASHDLRTPLTAIQGYLEIVIEGTAGELSDEQRELLEIAHRNAIELAGLIGDLLDLARIEAGGLQLRVRPMDVNLTVTNVLSTLALAAAEKGIALKSSLERAPRLVTADPARLNQVLLNLAGNAVKFTDRGGVTIGASEADGWVIIEVTDTGIGIPAEMLPHIFEEFSQGGEEARRKGGAGLGLAIVKQLVELHEGTIVVESTKGEGSRFTVRLPAALEYDAL